MSKDVYDLKEELLELIHYDLATDLIHYPLSKAEFSPYVVIAYSLGNTMDKAIIESVLQQLDQEIERIEKYEPTTIKKTFTDKVRKYLAKLKRRVCRTR